WLLDDFLVSLALSCLMYVALATSWAMFSGATRYVSLGTSAFFGLGAYVSAWTVAAAPWPVVIAGGALIAAAFAGLAGLAILHLRGRGGRRHGGALDLYRPDGGLQPVHRPADRADRDRRRPAEPHGAAARRPRVQPAGGVPAPAVSVRVPDRARDSVDRRRALSA